MAQASGTFSGRSTVYLRLTVNQGGQSVSGNYTDVSWYLDTVSTGGTYTLDWTGSWAVNINGSTYSGGHPPYQKYATTRVASGSTRIAHNADGSKSFNFSASASGVNLIGNASLSGSMGLTTIPRASTATFSGGSSFDAGTAVTINTNRASTAFTHTIKYEYGAANGTLATGVGASYVWTPPLTLLEQIPNLTSATGTITVTTYSGSTLIGSKVTGFTIKAPTTVIPTINSLVLSEANSQVTSAAIGAYVAGVSKLKGVVTASGIYKSTIVDSIFKTGNIEAASGSSIDLSTSGTVAVVAEVTDSRGRKATSSQNITVLAYDAPEFVTEPIVRRATSSGTVSDGGTYLRVDLDALVSSLMVGTTQKNTLKIEAFTKVRGTTSWGTAKNTINHTAITYKTNFTVGGGGTYVVDDSFDVLIRITDKFNIATFQTTVSTSRVFQHWSKTGVGIGKYHQDGALDVAGDIYQSGSKVISEATISSKIASQTEVDAGTINTKFITPKSLKTSLELPKIWVGSGNTSITVASTAWSTIPGNLRYEMPAYDRPLLVETVFSGLGLTNSGYWMIGISIFDTGTWSILPESVDPQHLGNTTSGAYALYAPFSQSTQQVQLFGSKSIIIPAGIAPVFQMAARKSVSSAAASMNYTTMEVRPIRWL